MDARCGNQLFHYAVDRYVQLVTNDTPCLNFNRIFDMNASEKEFVDYLKDFKLIITIIVGMTLY